jgi:hypothetical protein
MKVLRCQFVSLRLRHYLLSDSDFEKLWTHVNISLIFFSLKTYLWR